MPSKTARPAYFPTLAAERPDIALCRASAYLARAADAHAGLHGLGVGQHLVLKMLDAVGPCSQQVLAEELRIDRSVMVNVCDDLERSGFVRRDRNPDDRRSYAVTITGEGRERLAEAERTVPSYLDEILAPLTPDERARLATLVGKLLEF
ncbi:MarR family winged helix-turn-helix transcriptional regulator [Actinomadura sp. NEAU-AAG7]|uniref:MarR family winged helix-turn-helix transcriptional regulator n=1 Tax=Actinomadura sp. NEAU-AAG7 TaxID=2839640 RepID=UPI001BE4B905|nr:MarR family transcriptional regulator [Actinomadura sp. NEAU-AAG7]MBT2208051.1 MarR family transcriptional regulator [Actinomadura sp. NEAU-AAG7]